MYWMRVCRKERIACVHCDCPCVRVKIGLQPRPCGCPVSGIRGNPEKRGYRKRISRNEEKAVYVCTWENTETNGKGEGSAMVCVMERGGGDLMVIAKRR